MSLLMQALKKAERAKQNALPEDVPDQPSHDFDDVLALTPEAPAPAPAQGAPLAKRELSLDMEPMSGLSLEPLATEPPASLTPRPMPDPQPAHSDHKEPGLTLDLAPDPSAPPAHSMAAPAGDTQAPGTVAWDAPADGHAAAAAADDAARGTGAMAGSGAARDAARAGLAAWDAPAAGSAPRGTAGAGQAASSAAAGTPGGAARGAAGASQAAWNAAATGAAAPAAQASAAKASGKGGSERPRGSARARTASAAANTGEPSGIDPERLRLIGLIALLVVVIGGFGFYYWHALAGPGAGASLPPVPMPPPGATGATPAQVIAAGPGGTPSSTSAPAAPAATPDSSDALLAPPVAPRATVSPDLERRLAHTEQELAAAQQAIQAAAARQAPQLPPLAAPESSDIRVARTVQPAPVSPALDSAYQAFNNGDWTGAQQQYAAVLQQDPNNRDALLGMAIALSRQNQKDKAAGYYQRMLELWPNDATAAANLVALRQGDPAQNEARLKSLLANNPDAGPVLFELGNLYAQQGRWPDAQATYFRAYTAAPDNPDYAYNLAIGLDRLNQPKLAITYYQRALALAQDKAVAFDRNVLRKRLHDLSASAIAPR